MTIGMARALAVAALSLPPLASASNHSYSSMDLIEAQIALAQSRPKDCPPWYDGESCPPRRWRLC